MKRVTNRSDGWPRKISQGRVTVTVYRHSLPSGNWRYRVDNRALTGRFDSYQNEPEALEAAERLAKRIETGETKAALLTDNQAMEFILASDALGKFGLSIHDASAWLGQALRKVGDIHKLNEALNFYETHHRKITNITVADAVEKLLEKKKNKSKPHLDTIRSILGRFARAFACNIGDVTTPQIQSYLDKCEFESELTYESNRNKINQLFRFAFKQRCCMRNEADDVERLDAKPGDVGIYLPDEITKLLTSCPPNFLPCMAIGAFAGLRSAEVERLEWSCINWETREFYLNRNVTKTGYPRTVPIQDNLMAWLAEYKDFTGKVWKGTHDAYYDTQSDVSQQAGVEWVHNGLRHSFGTYRCRALSGDVTKVSTEMGNSKAMVENHYKMLVPASDAAAWFAVRPQGAANIVSLARA